MTVEVLRQLVCDGCGETANDVTMDYTAAELRAQARAQGWRRRRGRDLCDRCATSEDRRG